MRADDGGERDAAHLEAAEQVGVLRDELDHLPRDAGQQERVGLEEVLVEVGVGDLAGAERELPASGGTWRRCRRRASRRWWSRSVSARQAVTASRLHGIPPTIFAEMSALAVRTGVGQPRPGLPRRGRPARGDRRGGRGAARAAPTSTPPGPAYPPCAGRSPTTSGATTASSSTPTPRSRSPPAAPRAIAAALLGLVEPGDEVVVLEPYYDSYLAMLQMAGGVRRPVTLRSPDFRVDLDELRAAVTPRTRFVLLNSPHNPTGTVLTRAELEAVAALAVEHDLTVITDEVYEHLVFDGAPSTCRSRRCPGMAERTLTLSSVGKSYSLTGWKVGWATGPAHLVAARRRGQAVADLHLRRAAAAGRRRRPRPSTPTGPLALAARPAGAPRPARRRARGAGLPTTTPAGHLLRHLRRQRPRLGRRPGLLPGPARARRRRRDPGPGLLRRPARRRPAPGAVGVLQAARGARRGRRPGWPRADLGVRSPRSTGDSSCPARCRPTGRRTGQRWTGPSAGPRVANHARRRAQQQHRDGDADGGDGSGTTTSAPSRLASAAPIAETTRAMRAPLLPPQRSAAPARSRRAPRPRTRPACRGSRRRRTPGSTSTSLVGALGARSRRATSLSNDAAVAGDDEQRGDGDADDDHRRHDRRDHGGGDGAGRAAAAAVPGGG